MKKTLYILTLIISAIVAFGTESAAQNILILQSYHQGLEWTDDIEAGMDSVLDKELPRAEIFVEYMDAKRYFPDKLYSNLRTLYAGKYQGQVFDLILCADDDALDFLSIYHDELFPEVPVVFCGVNDVQKAQTALARGFVGDEENHDVKGTIDIALQLFPKTSKVAVVSDDTLSGRANRKQLQKVESLFQNRIDFLDISGFSESDLKRSLAMLPLDTVVLLLGYQQDANGGYLSAAEESSLVATYSGLPVFTTWDFKVRAGVLGGLVTSGWQHGRLAAQRAVSILRGEKLEEHFVIKEKPNVYMFDYAALKHFLVDVETLPDKSVLLNVPRNANRKLSKRFCVALGGIGALACLAVALVGALIQRNRASQALLESREQLDTMLQSIGDQICMLDGDLTILWANNAFNEVYGNDPVGRKCCELFCGRTLPCENASCPCLKVFENGQEYTGEFEVMNNAGQLKRLRSSASIAHRDTRGKPSSVLLVSQDITAQRESQEKIYLARYALDSSMNPLCKLDLQGHVLYCNHAFLKLWGYAFEEDILGWPLASLVNNSFAAQAALLALEKTGEWSGEFKGVNTDGHLFEVEVQAHVVKDPEGEPLCLFVNFFDNKEKMKTEKEIRKLAYFDPVTNLPNRNLFMEELNERLVRGQTTRDTVAVILIDLDEFKQVNDSLGHPAGDELLRKVAQRMSEGARRFDLLTRWGGDEFLLMVASPKNREAVAKMAQDLLSRLSSQPFNIDGTEIYTSASLGIAYWPDDGETSDLLIKNADTALYEAKGNGRNTWRFFSEDLNFKVVEKQQLHARLQRALKEDEFFLAYQPQIDFRTGRIFGVEALVRWQDPVEGLVSPEQFIPFAEANGLILPLGMWVLRTACMQAMEWQKANMAPLKVGVNLSLEQLKEPELIGDIAHVLEETGLDPCFLELEITESVFVENMAKAMNNLVEIKAMGISLAIDDFGTGYSSLCYLKNFPVDRIKVAQEFVRHIPEDLDDRAIVEATIAMAQSLKVRLIAEGVENQEQADFLAAKGCYEMQGYYFARPMLASDLTDYINSQDKKERPSIYRSSKVANERQLTVA